MAAAIGELKLKGDVLAAPAASIFVGGGTPTSLEPDLLDELLAQLHRYADGETEFTVEANPGTIDTATADVLVRNGVNRVSLGVQSFDAKLLDVLGRIHTPQQTHEALRILRGAGVGNISLDLIYGIPGQSLEMWSRDLDEALAADTEHLSAYALSFEENTPLWDDLEADRVSPVNDELQRAMYYHLIETTASRGLEQYEISNFARAGRRCKHNITYWLNKGYLGVGPAAASYIGGRRSVNAPDLQDYLERIEAGTPPQAECEQLVGRSEMGETLMLQLRLTEGVKIASFTKRFAVSPTEAFPRSIGRYLQSGALVETKTHIRLSREHFFTADTVLADILAEV